MDEDEKINEGEEMDEEESEYELKSEEEKGVVRKRLHFRT